MSQVAKSMSKAEKRAHHNSLERKRRDHIKVCGLHALAADSVALMYARYWQDSFTVLREAVPALVGQKTSRAQILNKATSYIQYMRDKNNAHLVGCAPVRAGTVACRVSHT